MSRIARSFAFCVVALAGCAELDTSSTTQESHSWGGYHWARTANPFTLKIGDNVSSVWDPYLSTTISDWSKSTVLDMTKVTGLAKGRCRGTTGRVEVCNNTYGSNGWLGVASISVSGTHITVGTVKLNDTYFNTAKYNTAAWRNLVSCQEVGHTIGLDHQDEVFDNPNLNTCMDYTNDPTGTAGTNGTLANTSPNKHDYDELVTIYSHLDSTTTVGQATAGAAAAGESPAEWGELISSSRGGLLETYRKDHGGDDATFTFVTWAQ